MPLQIYIDADACPVREETYKVARRHEVAVTVVSNSFIRTPREPLIRFIAVSDGFDAADDYIAERADSEAVVITSDIPRRKMFESRGDRSRAQWQALH